MMKFSNGFVRCRLAGVVADEEGNETVVEGVAFRFRASAVDFYEAAESGVVMVGLGGREEPALIKATLREMDSVMDRATMKVVSDDKT